MRILVGACALVACVGGSVSAQAKDCWNAVAIEAAHVRNLQSLLMSSALQCRLIKEKIDVIGDYNRFINGKRTELETINKQLKEHFVKSEGSAALGQVQYDRFTTSLANYATRDRKINDAECRKMVALAKVAAQASGEMLVNLALSQGSSPELPNEVCARAPANAPVMAATSEDDSFAPLAPEGEFGPIAPVRSAQGIPSPTFTAAGEQGGTAQAAVSYQRSSGVMPQP